MNIEDVHTTLKAAKDSGIPVDQLALNTLEKPTKELGEGLGNLFWLAFSPIHVARASLEPRINNFKENLEAKLAAIPKANLIEPPLNIVGPTLEAAKYHIEDEDLREMFANLIASAMDSRMTSIAHPAFVEIIKQMSPLDAKVLIKMIENKWPIAGIKINTYKDPTNRYSQNNVYSSFNVLTNFIPLEGISIDNAFVVSASIDNLCRLSLISVDPDLTFTDTNRYKVFESHPIINQFKEHYKEQLESSQASRVEFKRGSWSFTEFGKLFIDFCLPQTKLPS